MFNRRLCLEPGATRLADKNQRKPFDSIPAPARNIRRPTARGLCFQKLHGICKHSILLNGCGSTIGTPNGTLVNGKLD